MTKELATQLIEQLQAAGVQRIYGIVGDSLNPIVDAVRQTGGAQEGGIDWTHLRSREAAALPAAARGRGGDPEPGWMGDGRARTAAPPSSSPTAGPVARSS